MDCPKCGYYNTLVYDSRNTENYTVVRRRRECQKCGYRFTTYERILSNEERLNQKAYKAIETIKKIVDNL